MLLCYIAKSMRIQSIQLNHCFCFFVCTVNTAAGPPHGSAAGKGVRGIQAPPGAAKLPGPKLEQGEDTIFNRGMSFTFPLMLLNLLSLIINLCVVYRTLKSSRQVYSLSQNLFPVCYNWSRQKFIMPFWHLWHKAP